MQCHTGKGSKGTCNIKRHSLLQIGCKREYKMTFFFCIQSLQKCRNFRHKILEASTGIKIQSQTDSFFSCLDEIQTGSNK